MCGAPLSALTPGTVNVHQDRKGRMSVDARQPSDNEGPIVVKSEALRGKIHRKHRKELARIAKLERKRLALILKIEKKIVRLRRRLAQNPYDVVLAREIEALTAQKKELEDSVHRGIY